MKMKSKSYDKYPSHRTLYDALVKSLIVDDDVMDKKLEDQSTPKKKGRDDNDQDPFVDSQKEKKKEKQKDSESLKKDKDQVGSSMKDAGKSIEDDVVDVEDPSQADANVPKSDKSTSFKMVLVERPESPNP
uniref:Uncharacterized protein n=1 Tax=Tanacetum cinerariifolium TaxID=118510 RepID=A0A6L2LH78_TANCI|nr:hypothetical protein [Tanacetum cinerariifolium]